MVLAPLNVPLRATIGTGIDPSVLAEVFEGWLGNPESQLAPARLYIEQRDDLLGTTGTNISVLGTDVKISGPGVSARADPVAGIANCAVSSEYLASPTRLREDILEPLVLTMIACRDRVPLHASGFLLGDLAVLLGGHSGAGKSCLAKAADDLGFQLLSDDVVYVQRFPQLCVWGWPKAAHLLPEDARLAEGPSRLRNGTHKRVIPLRSASIPALNAKSAVLCMLAHGSDVSLAPMETQSVLDGVFPLDPGFDMFPREIACAVEALTANGAWNLRLSDEPEAAIRLLTANASRLRSSAVPCP